ncbi:autophagy-related 18a [Anaeramoeba flamelloides]|uniref:Autophagy-related 18a n=1 Tax=Anaeramoeba flamelloides TaxID=1746091 RepID=A0ABQ8Z8H6_9EUKA|nr:autophagy-related 18a [Anaeramoeba flamelloides]
MNIEPFREKSKEIKETLTYLGFNQDYSFAQIGYKNGYKLIKTSTLEKLETKETDYSIEMFSTLYSSSLIIIRSEDGLKLNVLIRKKRKENKNENEKENENENEKEEEEEEEKEEEEEEGDDLICSLEFEEPIISIKQNCKYLVVCTENKICVYLFEDLTRGCHRTFNVKSSNGAIALSSSERSYLAYSEKNGDITVRSLDDDQVIKNFNAHQSAVLRISISQNGSLLASVSIVGKNVRVFDLDNPKERPILFEFVRGKSQATAYGLCFSHDGGYLALTSDRGTGHIFCLQKTSRFSGVFLSVGSFAKIKLKKKVPAICAFSPQSPDQIFVLSSSGTLSIYKMDLKKGGECKNLKSIEI